MLLAKVLCWIGWHPFRVVKESSFGGAADKTHRTKIWRVNCRVCGTELLARAKVVRRQGSWHQF